MNHPLSIGGIAKAAGVPTSTIRYYERRGLLPPDTRSRSRYRQYGVAALERLRFIRAAQASGFALADIATLLELREETRSGHACRTEVARLISTRLQEVERRMADLARVREGLEESLHTCCSAREGCGVLEQLTLSIGEEK